jgi:hypothetical protein
MEPPPKFVAAIKTVYTDLKVVLKIDKDIQEIPQSVGVQQGNNMAPVFFLFLMSAAAETLKSAWKQAGIKYQLLYVNDGAIPFPTCAALIKGLALVHSSLHALALKYTLDKMMIPPKLNVCSFPLPNSLRIFNPLLQR